MKKVLNKILKNEAISLLLDDKSNIGLLLADFDGKVLYQSNTAQRIVGQKILFLGDLLDYKVIDKDDLYKYLGILIESIDHIPRKPHIINITNPMIGDIDIMTWVFTVRIEDDFYMLFIFSVSINEKEMEKTIGSIKEDRGLLCSGKSQRLLSSFMPLALGIMDKYTGASGSLAFFEKNSDVYKGIKGNAKRDIDFLAKRIIVGDYPSFLSKFLKSGKDKAMIKITDINHSPKHRSIYKAKTLYICRLECRDDQLGCLISAFTQLELSSDILDRVSASKDICYAISCLYFDNSRSELLADGLKRDISLPDIDDNKVKLIARANERKAESLIDSEEYDNAKKLLNENMNMGAGSDFTYDLLLKIFLKEDDYSGAIKVLNNAIQYSDNKEKYRTLRKKIIFRELIEDLELDEQD